MNTSVMFSCQSDNWSTPKDFYDKLDREFGFDFDPCPLNAEHDALSLSLLNGKGSVLLIHLIVISRGLLKKVLKNYMMVMLRLSCFLFLQELIQNGFMSWSIIRLKLGLLKVDLNLEILKTLRLSHQCSLYLEMGCPDD